MNRSGSPNERLPRRFTRGSYRRRGDYRTRRNEINTNNRYGQNSFNANRVTTPPAHCAQNSLNTGGVFSLRGQPRNRNLVGRSTVQDNAASNGRLAPQNSCGGSKNSTKQCSEPSNEQSDTALCGICYSAFDARLRIPKVLHCGHTFCALCIKKFPKKFKQMVLCPSCRRLSMCRYKDLATNYCLMEVLEKLSLLNASVEPINDDDAADSARASLRSESTFPDLSDEETLPVHTTEVFPDVDRFFKRIINHIQRLEEVQQNSLSDLSVAEQDLLDDEIHSTRSIEERIEELSIDLLDLTKEFELCENRFGEFTARLNAAISASEQTHAHSAAASSSNFRPETSDRLNADPATTTVYRAQRNRRLQRHPLEHLISLESEFGSATEDNIGFFLNHLTLLDPYSSSTSSSVHDSNEFLFDLLSTSQSNDSRSYNSRNQSSELNADHDIFIMPAENGQENWLKCTLCKCRLPAGEHNKNVHIRGQQHRQLRRAYFNSLVDS